MSIDAISWAWAQQLRPAQKLVLLSLADRAGENNICWPSLKRLRKDTGLDIKTVRAALAEMCRAGLISRSEQPGRGYTYTLNDVPMRERRHAASGSARRGVLRLQAGGADGAFRAACPSDTAGADGIGAEGTGADAAGEGGSAPGTGAGCAPEAAAASSSPAGKGGEPVPERAGGDAGNGASPLPKTEPESFREPSMNLKRCARTPAGFRADGGTLVCKSSLAREFREKNAAPAPHLSPYFLPVKSPGMSEVAYIKAENWQTWIETYGENLCLSCLKNAYRWSLDTPSEAKTARGIHKFLGGWIAREQNSGRRRDGFGGAFVRELPLPVDADAGISLEAFRNRYRPGGNDNMAAGRGQEEQRPTLWEGAGVTRP